MHASRPKTRAAESQETKGSHVFIYLFAIYVFFVASRFLLALLTSCRPLNNIDEFLYYGIARSVATKGALLFRGRYADYQFILYPLLLTPVYQSKLFQQQLE